MKEMIKILVFIIMIFSLSCSDEPAPGNPEFNYLPIINVDPIINKLLMPEDYIKQCIRHEWFFCDLNAEFRMKVTKDICFDPPKVLEVGECEEFLECDPTNYNMGTEECITFDGYPGTLEKICNKGKIQYTNCVSLCEEEVCDGVDNDCDDLIDESQLNACGECGFVPPESCDGLDNDCDGYTDEDLIQECSSACGQGVEFCIAGMWTSCSAPQPQLEICDGFDNDCDGQIDEEISCECTVQQVGILFPCTESPLLCGQGFKTCECTDPTCLEITTTDCYASCYWLDPSDPSCDIKIGQALEKEECNNFDDNCNQLIDEDLYAQCYTADPSTMYVGICEPGEVMCEAGSWGSYDKDEVFKYGLCKDEVIPQEEICNGLDDNCDGIIDTGEELDPVDIMFIVDWSGSMDTEIYAVMSALNKFAGNYSDEEVLQWGLIMGPMRYKTEINTPNYYKENLVLEHNLTGFSDFLTTMANLNLSNGSMSGSKEMLVDAIYLSIHNLVPITALPYSLIDLAWNPLEGVKESIPILQQFIVNWREDSEKVIIVFTDEMPQSYTLPIIDYSNLLATISQTLNLKIYVFSSEWHKVSNQLVPNGWEDPCVVSGGKWYELTSDMSTMYNNLMEIIDENACK
ncbi:MAG TPA: hypothetical protein EYN08_04420 [Gammaproteobacteria bacterium]|nr:hypothetical protein [Gammaproteobacteria bacterium]